MGRRPSCCVFFALLGNLFAPWGVAGAPVPRRCSWPGSFLLKLLVLAAAVAGLETAVAKLRLFRVPELLSVSFVLALLAVSSSFLVAVTRMDGDASPS